MLLDYIEQLRTRSKEERKRFSVFFSVGCTSVVVLVWLSVRWFSFSGGGISDFMGVDLPKDQTASLTLPKGVFEGANTFLQNTKADIQTFSQQLSSSSAMTEASSTTLSVEAPETASKQNPLETTSAGMIRTTEE